MTAFWPEAGWWPWDALVAAGFRATNDRRNVAPPVVLFEVEEESYVGTAGNGCTVVECVVLARALGPAPGNADAYKWAWTGPVPILIGLGESAQAVEEFEGLPCVEVRIPVTYKTGGQ